MSKFKSILEYILDNMFDIATIFVAGYLVIREQFLTSANTTDPNLNTWILAVLGLIAVSGLWERNRRLNRIEKIAQEGRDLIQRRLSGKVKSGDFFLKDFHISAQNFAAADTIYVSGMTLMRTTREYMNIWGKRLIAGSTVRIIIVESKNKAILHELTLRSEGDTTVQHWHNRIKTVEKLVEVIARTPGCTGKLELGHLPYIPSFGMIMTDPYKPNGVNYVELYNHRSSRPNPTFELSATDDPEFFEFFREQFEIMWKGCRVETFETVTAQKASSKPVAEAR